MTRTAPGRRPARGKSTHRPDEPSSPGDSPVAQTPKEVDAGHAAARDLSERKVHSDDPAERREALLDEASDLSFPASDPIAVSSAATRKDRPAKANPDARPGRRSRSNASGPGSRSR